MFSRRFVVFAVALALVLIVTRITPAQNERTSADVEIRNLMTQKRDVLKERLDGVQQLLELGGIREDRVLIARTDVLRAELELATSRAERIAVLDSQLKTRQEIEKLLSRRYKDGTDNLDAKLLATADRLEAKISLLREKAKL
jgi:outer membrane protein TolC